MSGETVIVVIPAFNEEGTIGEVVGNVPVDVLGSVKILVVDDGSTDATVKVAEEAGADYILKQPRNMGLGVAFKMGVESALRRDADYIVNIDADMQFNPRDIPKLLQPLIDGQADVVLCSRFLDAGLEPEMSWIKKTGNKIFSRLVSSLSGIKITDAQCGFRAYTREAALRLNIFSPYTYTQESIIDLVAKGMRVKEISCAVKGEREGKSRVVDSVFSYTLRSLAILIRTVRDLHALEFFGGIGLTVLAFGFITGAFMSVRWIITGVTTPYQSLISVSILLLILGFLLLVLALQSDMQARQRRILEELLYYNKKRGIVDDKDPVS